MGKDPIGPLAWELPYAENVALKRKKKSSGSSLVVQWVKDLMMLQQRGSLLWHEFNPWPGNFHMFWANSSPKTTFLRKIKRKKKTLSLL